MPWKRLPNDSGNKWLTYLIDVVLLLAGALTGALSVIVFMAPSDIAPGGVSGVAIIANSLLGTPIGLTIFLLNIPILGTLFRSRDYQTQQTELVILVTPYLVSPSPANSIPVPTDRTVMASDAEGIFLGRLETIYGVGATGDFRGAFSGNVGFVLD